MGLFFEVVDELYRFAVDSIMRLFVDESKETPSLFPHLELAPAREERRESLAAPASFTQIASVEEVPQTFRAVEDILSRPTADEAQSLKNSVMYARGGSVPVFKNPTAEFDSIIGRLQYGDMVMAFTEKGRFCKVASNGLEGWVLRNELADRAALVYPEFVIGGENGIDGPNTVRVRAALGDEFGGGIVEYPLQAGEYVAYRLLRKGIKIPWTAARPRVPGMWHTILKGAPGVHIGVSPKTGSIMEFMLTDEIGHVAYVEAVFPDETITISEANFPDSGVYNERVLTRDEWKELRPIFIQIV